MYAPEIGSLGLDMTRKGTREQIFSKKSIKGITKLNWPSPWYPETKGYAVCQIKKGKLIYINFVACVFIVLFLGQKTILDYSKGFKVLDNDKGKDDNN